MELRSKSPRSTAKASRPRRALAAAAGIVLAVCGAMLLQAPPVRAAEDTRRLSVVRDPSGEGFVVPGTGLWFGGDMTVSGAVKEDEPAVIELDDLSLLVRYEPSPRLGFFTELRLDETIALVEGVGVERGSADISIERLYMDVLLGPHLTLRGGKFYTPFGLWNVIRRAPLTWTVEEPAVAEATFPRRATGLSLVYQTTWHGWSFDATGYGPAQDELALRQTTESGLMAGGRTAVGRSLGPVYAAVGLNGLGFEDHGTGRWADAYGADLDLTFRGHLLTGEFDYTHLRGPGVSREFGSYLQDAIPITSTLWGVLRVEHFQPRRGPSGVAGQTGLFWRPVPYLIIKTDYLFGDRIEDVMEPGFHASVALFF